MLGSWLEQQGQATAVAMMHMVASAMLNKDWQSLDFACNKTIYVCQQGVRGLTWLLWVVSHDGSGS